MRIGNTLFGIMLLAALVCALAVFVIEEVKFEGRKVAFSEPPMLSSSTLDLNTATFEELDAIDGVGERTAQKIIDFRQTQRPFETVQDLMLIRGIDVKKTEELLGKVYVK